MPRPLFRAEPHPHMSEALPPQFGPGSEPHQWPELGASPHKAIATADAIHHDVMIITSPNGRKHQCCTISLYPRTFLSKFALYVDIWPEYERIRMMDQWYGRNRIVLDVVGACYSITGIFRPYGRLSTDFYTDLHAKPRGYRSQIDAAPFSV